MSRKWASIESGLPGFRRPWVQREGVEAEGLGSICVDVNGSPEGEKGVLQ